MMAQINELNASLSAHLGFKPIIATDLDEFGEAVGADNKQWRISHELPAAIADVGKNRPYIFIAGVCSEPYYGKLISAAVADDYDFIILDRPETERLAVRNKRHVKWGDAMISYDIASDHRQKLLHDELQRKLESWLNGRIVYRGTSTEIFEFFSEIIKDSLREQLIRIAPVQC